MALLDEHITRVQVPDEVAARAAAAQAAGRVHWLVFSGKMASGKDTVAARVSEMLPGPARILGFGNIIRAELQPLLEIVWRAERAGATRPAIAAAVAGASGLSAADARELVDVVWDDSAASGEPLSAWDRTECIRLALQGLGDPWRLPADAGYWARPMAAAALTAMAEGVSPISTGGRSLADVEVARRYGATLIRLDVDRGTQIARLAARDGLTPSPRTLASLDHPNECHVDTYEHFHARIDAARPLDDVVADVMAVLKRSAAA